MSSRSAFRGRLSGDVVSHWRALAAASRSGCCKKSSIISSVSGGSIANGWLALKWPELTRLDAPASKACSCPASARWQHTTVDVWAVLGGIWTGKHRRGGSRPPMIACCSRVQNAALICPPHRCSSTTRRIADRRAVALYPRIHGRLRGRLLQAAGHSTFRRCRCLVGLPADPVAGDPASAGRRLRSEVSDPGLTDPAYRSRIVLADGGVYDNLGLEPIVKRARTVLAEPRRQPVFDGTAAVRLLAVAGSSAC